MTPPFKKSIKRKKVRKPYVHFPKIDESEEPLDVVFCRSPIVDGRGQSPMESWDAAYECRHGLLPQQACKPCGRTTLGGRLLVDEPYPGLDAIVAAERRHMRLEDRL